MSSDPLEYIESPVYLAQPLLAWNHAQYFVSVIPNPVLFSVVYQDLYGNLPTNGYPKVLYRVDGSSSFQSAAMAGGGGAFTASVNLSNGTYWYRYVVKNDQMSDEFALETSSFVVSVQPCVPATIALGNNAVVPNAGLQLSWEGNGDTETVYRLFLGKIPENLPVVYEGTGRTYRTPPLDYSTQYYWQVEAENQYGVVSQSPRYAFRTIGQVQKAFNYPNPFNPGIGEETGFVFMMAEEGSAELTVYTETGDQCWHEKISGLLPGANEARYNGRDDAGRILYNGTYVCVIEKKYTQREEQERCRILVVK